MADERVSEMMDATDPEFAEWMATRPPEVQKYFWRAYECGVVPGCRMEFPGGEVRYFMGFSEQHGKDGCGVAMIVTSVNPHRDYDGAYEAREVLSLKFTEKLISHFEAQKAVEESDPT